MCGRCFFVQSFPVMRLFEQVGTVTLEQQGLYFSFHARMRAADNGFVRLYYHTEAQSVRVGLFCEKNGAPVCLGSISARRLGLQNRGVFSVTEQPWLPLGEALDCGMLPPGALYRREGDRRRVIVPDGPQLPCEIVPFFCFLVPETLEGLPCLSLLVDRHGRPVVPEIIL